MDFLRFVYDHPSVVLVFSVLFLIWGRMIQKGPRIKDRDDA